MCPTTDTKEDPEGVTFKESPAMETSPLGDTAVLEIGAFTLA